MALLHSGPEWHIFTKVSKLRKIDKNVCFHILYFLNISLKRHYSIYFERYIHLSGNCSRIFLKFKRLIHLLSWTTWENKHVLKFLEKFS